MGRTVPSRRLWHIDRGVPIHKEGVMLNEVKHRGASGAPVQGNRDFSLAGSE
jgi:hypothetical protein